MKLFDGLKSGVGAIKNRIEKYEIAADSMYAAKIPSGIAALSIFNYANWVHDNIGVPVHEALERGVGHELPEVSRVLGPLGAAIYIGADIGEHYYRRKAETLRETGSHIEKSTANSIKEAKERPGHELSAREIYWSVVDEMENKSPKRKGFGRITGMFSKSSEEKILSELRKNKEYYINDIEDLLNPERDAEGVRVIA